jgi:hypothetical protein
VSLFSALSAAVTLGCVYLLARYFTHSRAGALLGSIALLLSYTFWSQAVIAEVYTPGMAFLGLVMVMLLRWNGSPQERRWALFFAAALAGVSVGVHAMAALVAPVAAVFVLAVLAVRRATWPEWRRTLTAAALGAMIGIFLCLLAFLYIDWHNPPSSFINVMLYPSRSIWGLTAADMDSPFKRMWLTLSAVQWRVVMFQGGSEAALASFNGYMDGFTDREFSIPFIFLVLYGWWEMFRRRPGPASFMLGSTLFILFYVLNYHPGDQYVFFLPTYIPMAAAAGVGMGTILEWITQRGSQLSVKAVYILFLLGMVWLIFQPSWQARWQALKTGKADFVIEDYAFPIQNLDEPRGLARLVLSEIPTHSLLLMDWRGLYSTFYMAQVEGWDEDIRIMEATPFGSNGRVADSLIEEVNLALQQGWNVYADNEYPGLADHFRLKYLGTSRWRQILSKG